MRWIWYRCLSSLGRTDSNGLVGQFPPRDKEQGVQPWERLSIMNLNQCQHQINSDTRLIILRCCFGSSIFSASSVRIFSRPSLMLCLFYVSYLYYLSLSQLLRLFLAYPISSSSTRILFPFLVFLEISSPTISFSFLTLLT
jgi:hypothetical protein